MQTEGAEAGGGGEVTEVQGDGQGDTGFFPAHLWQWEVLCLLPFSAPKRGGKGHC